MGTNQFTKYSSTDASAPVLTGENGKLVALMDAILHDGYGALSGAGWAITFTAANKRVYTQGAGSNGRVLRLLDDGSLTGAARDCAWRGGLSASDIDTLSGAFPDPTTQEAVGSYCVRKSKTADNVARAWKCWADKKSFIIFIFNEDVAGLPFVYAFGDQDPFYTDTYLTTIMGGNVSGAAALATTVDYCAITSAAVYTAVNKHYVPQPVSGTGGSKTLSKYVPRNVANVAALQGGANTYKNGGDGNILLEPVELADPSPANIRGRWRGVWTPMHAATNFATGDTISGAGGYSGKTFEVMKGTAYGANGLFVIETSATLS